MKQAIYTHRLANGLVLLAEEMRSMESAAFTIRVAAGTTVEPADRNGLASLTCEMMLRGCGPRDSRQFIDDLDNLGVERGESVNGAHSSYSGATLARNLLPTLEIYADLLRRPRMPAEQLENGRLVCLQELAAVDDEPAQKVMLELRRAFFSDPWGRPSQGELAALKAITLDEITRYFQTCYQPDEAVIAVAGKIDWPTVKDTVERLFGDWKGTGPQPAKEQISKPAVRHLEQDSNQTQIGIAFPSVPYAHKDYFQAWGAVGVLSGGMSSRLFTEVREKRGLCYSVYASTHTLREQGAVLCYAGTTAERAQETLDVMVGELVRLAEGVDAWELDRLKARIKSSLIMQQESSGSRSSSLARDWYYLGRVRTMEEIEALVDGLTCDSINEYLQRNPPRDFTVVTLGPEPLEAPGGIR